MKAKPVVAVDAKVRRLMDDMVETMYHAIGIGLAAPQVGVAQRVLVVDVARDGEKPAPMRLARLAGATLAIIALTSAPEMSDSAAAAVTVRVTRNIQYGVADGVTVYGTYYPATAPKAA